MSVSWIVLIPEAVGHIPEIDRQKQALTKLRELTPESESVEAEVSEKVRFEHCGENFERILCFGCKRELDIKWWRGKMDEDFGMDADFKLRSYTMPCCGAVGTLHDLQYEWPQGLARFSLSAKNPNVRKLTEMQIDALADAMGCPLRVIYRYM